MIAGRMFPAEEIPDTIGAYRVVRRLPSVGVAELYLARSDGPHGFQRECVLKLLPDTSEGSAEFAEGLAREAAICAKLNHPAVVRVFDFFEHKGKLVLVLEHVEGTTLGDLMTYCAERRQKLGDPAVYHVGARLAGAIAEAHAAKDEQGQATPIIHRNLTPENVLISVDGEVRLSGFGVGKILGRTPDTAIGRIKGTPGFMAPEQARGEPVTPKADVYGLGVLLWSLFAGRRPPTDGTWPRRISGLRGDLPKEVAAVVDAALDHFPGTRKITAREMEQWLSKAAPPGKGKGELKERVASLRADAGSREPDAPSAPRPAFPAAGNPFQGVRFGAPASAAAEAWKPGDPRKQAEARTEPKRAPDPVRSTSSTALSRVLLDLPPPPPPDGPPPATTPAAPPIRFGAPPIDPPRPPEPPRPEPPRPAPPAPQLSEPPLELEPDPSPEPMASAEMPPMVPLRPLPSRLLAAALPSQERPRPPPVEAAPVRAKSPRIPNPTLAPNAPTPLATAASRMAALEPPPPSSASPSAPAAPAGTPTVRPPGARRPLSPAGTIGVSAITATLVVAAAFYVFLRRDHAPPEPVAIVASATTRATAAPTPAAPTSAPTPTPSAEPAPSANPADLPYGFGYLLVTSPASANVYLSGKIAGPVNQPLKVRCGRWFVRLAAPPETRYPEWVSSGETVVVACQQQTRVDLGGPKP
jgi:serine/threonine-protein kinase